LDHFANFPSKRVPFTPAGWNSGVTCCLVTTSPDIKAAGPFYGPNPLLQEVPNIKAAVLGIYASKDSHIADQVPMLEQALKDAKIVYKIEV